LLLTSSLYRNGSMSNRAQGLLSGEEKAHVCLNPQDADALKLTEEDKLVLTSRNGEIQAAARVLDEIPAGTIQMNEGFTDANPRSLLYHELDPVTKSPMARFVQVRIRKI
jgi:predicted molibdopterin-dependent oxidoreductase YjgC